MILLDVATFNEDPRRAGEAINLGPGTRLSVSFKDSTVTFAFTDYLNGKIHSFPVGLVGAAAAGSAADLGRTEAGEAGRPQDPKVVSMKDYFKDRPRNGPKL